MVRLGRWVRFSIDPFLDGDVGGSNSYASKPAGEGLALFLELGVELSGAIVPQTGLLVNVSDIDRIVRQHAVPVFREHIARRLARGEHVSLAATEEILRVVHETLADRFAGARVEAVILKLNPFRKLTMNTNERGMMYFSEKFEFAATHKLWNDAFSDERNFEVFGKCANPAGHGHNYLVEVTVKSPADAPPQIGRFERVVNSQFMQLVDHRNLNLDVPEFGKRIATVENLAVFAWERLAGRFDPAQLHSVSVWESDRTYCSYYGPQQRD